MFKARTYQRLGSGQEGNIDVQSMNLPEIGSGQEGNIKCSKQKHNRELVLGKKVTQMFKARTYQRFGSGQEDNTDVQSKNLPEIKFLTKR